jgi:hypothetical protein
MEICLSLARAETHSGALEWFRVPIFELVGWLDVVASAERKGGRKR